jgi:hypothetical protein
MKLDLYGLFAIAHCTLAAEWAIDNSCGKLHLGIISYDLYLLTGCYNSLSCP